MTRERFSTEPDLEEILERELGKVIYTFTMDREPAGGAPEWVKKEWLRLSLPVREGLLADYADLTSYTDIITGAERDNEAPIPVYGMDAIGTLRGAGRLAAADFWAAQGFEIATFVFRSHEGELVEAAA